jgi:hypothetical protein
MPPMPPTVSMPSARTPPHRRGRGAGASCFGPAYEFALILDTELRRRKIRDRVPMTFVTSEPYIGHLGLDGVGDTKGLLESEMRERHIKWMTNARVTRSSGMDACGGTERGRKVRRRMTPFGYSMILPAFRGIKAVRHRGADQPARLHPGGQAPAQPNFKNVYSLGVCVAIPPIGPTPVPVGVPKTGFMIESMVTAVATTSPPRSTGASPMNPELERGVPCRFRRWRRALWPSRRCRRATSIGPAMANGCTGQGRFRKILPAQGAHRHQRAAL